MICVVDWVIVEVCFCGVLVLIVIVDYCGDVI